MKARFHCLFGISAFVLTLATGPVASACPVGNGENVRPQRPVVNNVSSQASSLRMQARQLRDRAVQLVRLQNGGGGGGWRGKGRPSTSGAAVIL